MVKKDVKVLKQKVAKQPKCSSSSSSFSSSSDRLFEICMTLSQQFLHEIGILTKSSKDAMNYGFIWDAIECMCKTVTSQPI